MDAIKVKQILNKFLKEEPTIVGNSGSLFWVKENMVAFLSINRYNPNKYSFVIRVPVLDKNSAELEVLRQDLEFDEKELCVLKLKMMELKENYEVKLIGQILTSEKSDPMDELLEEPKDE